MKKVILVLVTIYLLSGVTRTALGEQSQVQIRQAQERLKNAGFDPGSTDGVLGARTREALRQYQAKHGLPETGVFDDATLKALGIQPKAKLQAQRKYSLMSVEEARQLFEKLVESRGVSDLFHTVYGDWKVPKTGLDVQGIQINTSDYLVFAAAISNTRQIVPKGNLAALFPKLETTATDRSYAKDPLPRGTGGMRGLPFSLTGLLFLTTDLHLVDKTILTRRGWDNWTREAQVIERGGWVWEIGEVGIYIESKGYAGKGVYDNTQKLIVFDNTFAKIGG